MIHVAAVILTDEAGKILICKRGEGGSCAFLWEFPGGKLEEGESPEQAAVRECREELDISLAVGRQFMEVVHEYPDLTVRLTLFLASIPQGEPRRLEHNDIRWITVEEIDGFAFCPADEEILNRIKAEF